MSIRKRKNAYNVFRRSAYRVAVGDALADPEQYPYAPDYEDEKNFIAYHIYLDGYFFVEILMDEKIKYQVLTETMHPIFSELLDAEKELFDIWKKETY